MLNHITQGVIPAKLFRAEPVALAHQEWEVSDVLVDAFKSTLDEVREADLLVHVVDVSHPDFEEQIRVVGTTLADLGCAEKPSITVFNKMDAYTFTPKAPDDLTPRTKENITLEELRTTWMARMGDDCLFISAAQKQNIDALKTLLYNKVRALHVQKYPYNDFLYPISDGESMVDGQ